MKRLNAVLLSIALTMALLLTGCDTIKQLIKDDPIETIQVGISFETVITEYDEARTIVSNLCDIDECPLMHSAIGNIRNQLELNKGDEISIKSIEESYSAATASYIVIRAEVGERLEQLNDRDRELLTKYDFEIRNADRALRSIWDGADDKAKLDKILTMASSVAKLAKLYKF